MGKIIVSGKALAKIAAASAMECYGVVGFVPASLNRRFFSLLNKERILQGVIVKIDGRKVGVYLHVVIQGGVKVSEVAKTIISQVSYTFKNITSIEGVDVSVIIKGVKREV